MVLVLLVSSAGLSSDASVTMGALPQPGMQGACACMAIAVCHKVQFGLTVPCQHAAWLSRARGPCVADHAASPHSQRRKLSGHVFGDRAAVIVALEAWNADEALARTVRQRLLSRAPCIG